jgi:hypothetical protein
MICFGCFLSRASAPKTLPNLDLLSPQLCHAFGPLSHTATAFLMTIPILIFLMAYRTLLSDTEISHSCVPICHLTIRIP